MREQRSRVIKARVLLAIFVSTIVLSALHRHESVSTVAVDCTECAHHVHHYHLAIATTGIHDCLLCQFITLNYIAGTAVALVVPIVSRGVVANRLLQNVCGRIPSALSTRAPPCFGLIRR